MGAMQHNDSPFPFATGPEGPNSQDKPLDGARKLQLNACELLNLNSILFAGVERLQVLVGPGGIRRRDGTVCAVRAHLAAGHHTLQQVSLMLFGKLGIPLKGNIFL